MKIKQRALALLLSLTMVLTFMPALAFADDEAAEDSSQPIAAEEYADSVEETAPADEAAFVEETVKVEEDISVPEAPKAAAVPKSMTFKSDKPIQGYIGKYDAELSAEANCFLTITYSNKTETYKFLDQYDEETEEDYYGWYLDGKRDGKKIDNVSIDCDGALKAGNNTGYIRWYYNGEEDDYEACVEAKITVVGVANEEITGLTFKQKTPILVDYENRWDYAYDNEEAFLGNEITVTTSEYTRTYVYQKEPYKDGDDDYGYACTVEEEDYTWQEVIHPTYIEETNPGTWLPGSSQTVSVYLEGVKASGALTVNLKSVPKPVKAEIVQTNPCKAVIGQEYLYLEDLFGNGNKILITYKEGSAEYVREYVYGKYDGEYGFFYTDENGEKHSFWSYIDLDGRVPKGTKSIKGKLEVDWIEDEIVRLPVEIKTKASRYLVYVEYKAYPYTGKTITPKVVVKYWSGKKFKKMSSKWYTCKLKKGKKIGWYTIQIKFKKKYQKSFGKAILGGYDIVPKAPAITKATPGAGRITVTWKKFSTKDQKNISGFIIEYSTNKKFKNSEFQWVDNKKATKAVIKNLQKGKTYYVRVMSRKDIKEMTYWSNPSKTKKAKVK